MLQSRLRWGFATTAGGEVVIRNWYLVTGALAGLVFSVAIFLAVRGDRGSDSFGVEVLCLPAALFFLYSFYLEILGVTMGHPGIIYPVRVGLGDGLFPLFRGSVRVDDVLQASSLRKTRGMYVAYLSGEFGEAKILFDTKGGRDRFFAVLNKRHPNIKIYRWT